VLGLLFAYWITQSTARLLPRNLMPNEARIEVNGPVLLFCLGVAVLTGILSGLTPALQSARRNLVAALQEEGRGLSKAAGSKMRAGLVVAEVALAVVLLFGSGLTVRSFTALQ